MKRSEINKALKALEAMCKEYRFALPPFCHMTPEDWQNAGHAAWVSGRVGEAVLRYRKAVGVLQCDFPPVDFWMRDADVLARYGLLHDDLRLMADLVMQ